MVLLCFVTRSMILEVKELKSEPPEGSFLEAQKITWLVIY